MLVAFLNCLFPSSCFQYHDRRVFKFVQPETSRVQVLNQKPLTDNMKLPELSFLDKGRSKNTHGSYLHLYYLVQDICLNK